MGQKTFLVNGGVASTQLNGLYDDDLESALERELDYKPGQAKGDLAKRFGHLVGVEVRTVGEAFSDFTRILGCSINSLYKNMVTDIVGSTHLIVVDARFKRDAIFAWNCQRIGNFVEELPREGHCCKNCQLDDGMPRFERG